MTSRRRWTNEEEQVLIDQVRINPSNLTRAFRNASNIIGRSPHSCEQRWYGKVRHSETVFMTIGARNMSVNSKNSDNPQPVRLSIWRRILNLLGL
jgi:hypothetical protein